MGVVKLSRGWRVSSIKQLKRACLALARAAARANPERIGAAKLESSRPKKVPASQRNQSRSPSIESRKSIHHANPATFSRHPPSIPAPASTPGSWEQQWQ